MSILLQYRILSAVSLSLKARKPNAYFGRFQGCRNVVVWGITEKTNGSEELSASMSFKIRSRFDSMSSREIARPRSSALALPPCQGENSRRPLHPGSSQVDGARRVYGSWRSSLSARATRAKYKVVHVEAQSRASPANGRK